MRFRRLNAFDYITMITVLGILTSVILITSTGNSEPLKQVKRLTPYQKRVKRGAELLALTKTSKSDKDVCKLPGLNKILVPRVSGTQDNIVVRNYLVERLKKLKWDVELDTFTQPALQPLNEDLTAWKSENVTFSNVIGYSNRDADKQVVITAHFDSKLYPAGDRVFLAAVDSAVPVAMILSVMDNLNELLQNKKQDKNKPERGIVVVFFDGEEAFKEWTSTDSVYGSRHLANKWKKENFYPKMELFVLLDLIGGSNPSFSSSYKNTENIFERFMKIERELHKSGLTKYENNKTPKFFFNPPSNSEWGVEDDHKPFEHNGYKDIVHLIPVPFPPQWHDMSDDAEHLDCAAINSIQKVIQLWLAEHFGLHKVINM